LSDPIIPRIARNTAIYVFFTLIFNVSFGFFLALLSTFYVQRQSVGFVFRSIWLLPRMTPPVIYILMWQWFVSPTEVGFVNQLLHAFGQPPQAWLARHPMPVIILVNGIIGASFGMIIFSAAIKSIPIDLFRAARVDGASDLAIVRRIIVPMLKWPIMFMTVWQTLSLLASYEYILLLTDGGPFYKSEVWSLHAYHRAFSSLQFGYGASIALVLVAVAVVISFIMLRFFGFRRLMEPAKVGR
jgi:inositol-phosphate transport system permease protein